MTLRDAAEAVLDAYAANKPLAFVMHDLKRALLLDVTPAQRIHADAAATTHGWGCWSWGPEHYMCAVKKIKEMEDDGK